MTKVLFESLHVSATSSLLQLDDDASTIAEQLAGGPMGDARGIEVAVLGRSPSRVEQRGEQARVLCVRARPIRFSIAAPGRSKL